ncbi:hypothetical protein HKD37_09G025027 [Glycine soja]
MSTGGPHDVQIQNEHAFPPYGLPLNYTPPIVAYTPNKNVNNSTPIPIESQQPQTDHAHTHEIPHHNLADFEPCLGYATEGQAVGGIPLQNPLEGPQYHPQLHLLHSTTSKNPHAMAEMGKWWATHLQALRIWSSTGKGSKRTNEKTRAKEEGENEGETHATTVPISNLLIPHHPIIHKRPSLNQPQSLSTTQPMLNTTFSTNRNTNQKGILQQKAYRIHPKFRCHMLNLLSYLFDNSMVAIIPIRFPQPPFFRGYDLNTTCAYHRGALGHSIEHCMTLKHTGQPFPCVQESSTTRDPRFPTSRVQSFWMTGPLDESISCFLIKVDPWVLVPITFRGLYVLAIRGLHILACRGLHALAFRGLRVLIFILGPPPDIGGRPTVRAHPEREAITHLLCIPGQDFTHAAAKRRVWIMRTNMTTLTWIWMTLLFSNILPSDHNANLPLQMDRAHKTPSGPEEVQQGPGVSSSGYGPLSVLQGITPTRCPVDPKKSNRALGFPALVTGLCQSYTVPVPPARQAQGETPQQPGDGWQRPTDAPPSPLEFTSAHPQKGLGSSSSRDSFASWKINSSGMEKEEREETPLQGEDEVHSRKFNEGDLVLKKVSHVQKDFRGKWAPNYEGPFVVKNAFSDGTLILTNMDGEELPSPVNYDDVKRYYA